MTKTKKEIEELRNNPKILTDDELLEDLIKNTSSIENIRNKWKFKIKLGQTLTIKNINLKINNKNEKIIHNNNDISFYNSVFTSYTKN